MVNTGMFNWTQDEISLGTHILKRVTHTPTAANCCSAACTSAEKLLTGEALSNFPPLWGVERVSQNLHSKGPSMVNQQPTSR